MKGMTVYGDLTQVNGPEEFTVELTADGKAMFAASGDTTEGTWTAVDATTASLTDDAGDVYAIDYDTQNDTISLEFEGVKLIFASENGKANFTAYSFDEAKPITDANQYVGTWTLSAFGADGMYATGDITAMLGGTLSIEIKDDGTAVLAFGTENVDATYEVTDGKLILTANGTSMELRDFEGSLAMDFSESYGAEGAVLILSK